MFWPYHDTLFLNQFGENLGTFNDQALETYGEALGLDTVAFNSCLDDNRHSSQLRADLNQGQEQGVTSTPTLFVNGTPVNGAVPFAQLNQMIQTELNNAG